MSRYTYIKETVSIETEWTSGDHLKHVNEFDQGSFKTRKSLLKDIENNYPDFDMV